MWPAALPRPAEPRAEACAPPGFSSHDCKTRTGGPAPAPEDARKRRNALQSVRKEALGEYAWGRGVPRTRLPWPTPAAGPLLSTVRAWPHWTALSSASGGVGCPPRCAHRERRRLLSLKSLAEGHGTRAPREPCAPPLHARPGLSHRPADYLQPPFHSVPSRADFIQFSLLVGKGAQGLRTNANIT